jgi:hypothetical protein
LRNKSFFNYRYYNVPISPQDRLPTLTGGTIQAALLHAFPIFFKEGGRVDGGGGEKT